MQHCAVCAYVFNSFPISDCSRCRYFKVKIPRFCLQRSVRAKCFGALALIFSPRAWPQQCKAIRCNTVQCVDTHLIVFQFQTAAGVAILRSQVASLSYSLAVFKSIFDLNISGRAWPQASKPIRCNTVQCVHTYLIVFQFQTAAGVAILRLKFPDFAYSGAYGLSVLVQWPLISRQGRGPSNAKQLDATLCSVCIRI